ncbi:NadR type nicotinamide-nucleotide adenylyltransferase [Pedobacter cryoconitis]|uniref:NadR type nicotinamide-nucleotide adenylyltransferase n=1 Tax=Pedobacter cryoconitis TaxID=188932 RepID=A0A7W8ZKD5_9SPHI|nr:ATP-binding protein [Pedobacter cryoconitis]MBB5635621.1 NadR type nicotinamide-nucleotide adenylyltransferase [Pedobacter cryoconitis]MBB6273504.1 NadR type nicotinamide-nucleotide adenylyltransferase [Pedobacter cryoconitis]
MTKKIAIVGPESTGKSTLTKLLAKHYDTLWVAEYARYYCAALTAPCTMQDEINMFHGQIALEESILAITEKDFIFCDTTFLTVKIWSDEMLGETPQMVLDALSERTYDLYILLDIDLPWQEDPLRDFPHMREHFMATWHKELKNLEANYIVVGGIENRLQNAIAAVDQFLRSV